MVKCLDTFTSPNHLKSLPDAIKAYPQLVFPLASRVIRNLVLLCLVLLGDRPPLLCAVASGGGVVIGIAVSISVGVSVGIAVGVSVASSLRTRNALTRSITLSC